MNEHTQPISDMECALLAFDFRDHMYLEQAINLDAAGAVQLYVAEYSAVNFSDPACTKQLLNKAIEAKSIKCLRFFIEHKPELPNARERISVDFVRNISSDDTLLVCMGLLRDRDYFTEALAVIAARLGDIDTLVDCRDSGVNLYNPDAIHKSPAFFAAHYGQTAALTLCVQAFRDKNPGQGLRYELAVSACKGDQSSTLKFCLENAHDSISPNIMLYLAHEALRSYSLYCLIECLNADPTLVTRLMTDWGTLHAFGQQTPKVMVLIEGLILNANKHAAKKYPTAHLNEYQVRSIAFTLYALPNGYGRTQSIRGRRTFEMVAFLQDPTNRDNAQFASPYIINNIKKYIGLTLLLLGAALTLAMILPFTHVAFHAFEVVLSVITTMIGFNVYSTENAKNPELSYALKALRSGPVSCHSVADTTDDSEPERPSLTPSLEPNKRIC